MGGIPIGFGFVMYPQLTMRGKEKFKKAYEHKTLVLASKYEAVVATLPKDHRMYVKLVPDVGMPAVSSPFLCESRMAPRSWTGFLHTVCTY